MGTVHGVYLKYVGLSAISYAGYAYLSGNSSPPPPAMATRSLQLAAPAIPLWKVAATVVLGYSALINGAIAVLFKMERGMGLLGKDRVTGKIPAWSYVVFFPFHLPTLLYTHIHTRHSKMKATNAKGEKEKVLVPVASEVKPGWWVGGWYANELDRDWAGVIDLTVEFPERCINRTQAYLSLPTWDGVPASPEQLEKAATFAIEARKKGDVLIHCAHGRGRSTTVMCAAMVKAGMYNNYEEALEQGIKPGRPVCKLNSLMKKSLAAWQAEYIDGKKGQ
uniref:Tyrosine specific protein phosphatases domain-containing protein n=1 Tax=Cyclophora tenuis TaxID=216820 RepID=A0A7S1GLN7_CYCTE|mmetsp:Transcript_22701/g.38613  ORF Transcript_22701/g.38613 Transcript_22701/m.38613 type:complete len:278 (+) Transcript_22701:34-867(+)